jgi:hypothetical protein
MKLSGELLITMSLIVTALGSLIHDWNKTHVYNPEWPPHARFHFVSVVAMNFALGALGLWLLWGPSEHNTTTLFVSALIPIIVWGSFFAAIAVPGCKAEDHPGQVPRLADIPINMLAAAAFCLTSIVGYFLAS